MQITIDDKNIEARRGMTILEAAQENGIHIPTLCVHKDLHPSGACRMCMVEVEGMRGNPTACTTPITEHMVVHTNTQELMEARREILQLILAKHPSGCLLCDQGDNCSGCMETIRKVGITTGCKTCPKDGMCELQDIVEQLDIKDLKYPAAYRGFRIEKFDPFYDRDYNLCILCGRCVQVCQEVRLAGTLAFIQRGHRMSIGPAFGRTHMESRCEFCGSCVSLCPTGALSEKVRKWDGKPNKEIKTTCPFCGLGCQFRLQIKDNEIIGVLGDKASNISSNHLCVKGRFGVPEMVNHPSRLKKPSHFYEGIERRISWQEAVKLVSEKLASCSPDEFQMYLSPDCTNEDLYVAQKFCRLVMGSNCIESSAERYFGKALNNYLRLFQYKKQISNIKNSDVIFSIGLDPRFNRSVIGVEIKKAVSNGATLITLHPNDHHLNMITTHWLRNVPGKEDAVINTILKIAETGNCRPRSLSNIVPDSDINELFQITQALKNSSSKAVILVGVDFLQYDNAPEILSSIEELARKFNIGIIPLAPFSNFLGSYYMGTMSGFLPGGSYIDNVEAINKIEKIWQSSIPNNLINARRASNSKIKILYLIGEPPPKNLNADMIVYQNCFPFGTNVKEAIILPSAEFSEVDGSFINIEGRVQRIKKAIPPQGEAKPNWQILCFIAQNMGYKGFNFKNYQDIEKEICSLVDGFDIRENRKIKLLSFNQVLDLTPTKNRKRKVQREEKQLILKLNAVEDNYHGFPLSKWVGGMEEILLEGKLLINPSDAGDAGIRQGDLVELFLDSTSYQFPALISSSQPQGTINLSLQPDDISHPNPTEVKIRNI